MNKVVLIGNLGTDPETKVTEGGRTLARFRLATNESYKTESGERKEVTEWHNIIVWGRQAELVGQYCKQGRMVAVEGQIRTREYTTKEGERKFFTEIHADHVEFLSRPRENGADLPNDDIFATTGATQ